MMVSAVGASISSTMRPSAEEQRPVCIAGRHWIVGNHDDGLAELPHSNAHEGENLGTTVGVEVSRRLVRKDDLRLRGKCAGYGDTLLLTAGELGRTMTKPITESNRLDDVVEPGTRHLSVQLVGREAQCSP